MTTRMRRKEDQNAWNFFFSVLFAALLGLSVWKIYAFRGGFPSSVPVLDAVLIALAVFRATRLLVYDNITRFMREWFVRKKEVTGEQGIVWIELTPYERGMRRTIYDLLQCPWCIGMWVSLVFVFCYVMFPWAWYVIAMLAAAGAAFLVQILANLIGWQAEKAKLETQEKKGEEAGRC